MIITRNLTKLFDRYEAVSNLSLEIQPGCIYGLVGTNGAGKSTLLRTLAGIYRPSSGEALLDDHPIFDHEGRLLMTREMDNLRTSYCKVQTAFKPAVETLDLPGLSILRTERVGSVWTLLVRGSEEEVFQALRPLNPVILDCISLTLEEVFISEMEAVGYDYNHIIF